MCPFTIKVVEKKARCHFVYRFARSVLVYSDWPFQQCHCASLFSLYVYHCALELDEIVVLATSNICLLISVLTELMTSV